MDKAKILIVDDTPVNIEILNEALESEFDTYFAVTGTDALQKAQSIRPDLILLDVMMPEMDGFTVCSELKSRDLLKEIPVIFITALNKPEDESKGLKLGAVDYVTKPFNPDLVLLRVRNHLELKSQRDALRLRTLELEKSLSEIKVLKAIIPVCMFCKKIRDDEGYWSQLDHYIRAHTDSEFSHGICPACLKNHYDED